MNGLTKCAAASSGVSETAGKSRARAIVSAMLWKETPFSATPCSTLPAGAFSKARRNRLAASSRCTAGHRSPPSPT
ncbi:hypothetical protein ADL28_13325 [Streptomyces violaceusniger]|uniref:Uncharacterized protein n=1 Tax=Streptomyces violaceusniger TaxID=68280 RepID=A0A0X3WZX8_STRVO|nr:hypothetical protein ADL28_13325 [Streptomyces violaceusniger]